MRDQDSEAVWRGGLGTNLICLCNLLRSAGGGDGKHGLQSFGALRSGHRRLKVCTSIPMPPWKAKSAGTHQAVDDNVP